jgi:hypothetical protein
VEKEISIAKRASPVPKEYDRTGACKGAGIERQESTQCRDCRTDELRKPKQGEARAQQRKNNEHQTRGR